VRIKLDRDLRRFLRQVRSGQSLWLGAWASRVLDAGEMMMADLEKCLNLGFDF